MQKYLPALDQAPRYGPERYSDSIRVALKRGPSVLSDARIRAIQAVGSPAASRS